MRVSDQTIESILKQGGVVDEPQLADLKLIAERSKQTLQETAIEQKVISEEDLTKLIGDYIGVPFVRIEPKDIPEDILLSLIHISFDPDRRRKYCARNSASNPAALPKTARLAYL